MPRMTGLQLVEELEARGDRIAVLLTSGYATAIEPAAAAGTVSFLNKPFTSKQLTAAVRQLIAAPE
jgi:FixJ family two-component response regulator